MNNSQHEIQILKVEPSDLEGLVELSQQTFIESFSYANTQENMQLYLEECLSYQKLMEELNDQNSMFFFVEKQRKKIGYMKLNIKPFPKEVQDQPSLEIERIYIRQKYQGQGLGLHLLHHAMEIAKNHTLRRIWLGVWEHNAKAIKFYERTGFMVFGQHLFMLGNDPQTDLLMCKDLT